MLLLPNFLRRAPEHADQDHNGDDNQVLSSTAMVTPPP